MEFVRGKGQQIDGCQVQIDGHFPGALRGIDVEQQILVFQGPGNFCNRLDDAGLVVDMHDRDQDGFVGYGIDDLIHCKHALAVRPDVSDPDPLGFQVFACRQDGFMLDGRGDDMSAGILSGERSAFDGQIVGFRGAGSEMKSLLPPWNTAAIWERAFSMADAASAPKLCWFEDGLAKTPASVKQGSIASTASGAIGVVAA